MNVSIIGGGGLVGSCAAFALQCGGIVSGLDLIDVNTDLCRGQALDLLHGASLAADQRIRATGYEAISDADLVLITAGLRRLPATQVTATILGEHGDSMVPVWSAAQAAGWPLEKFPGWTSAAAEALFA